MFSTSAATSLFHFSIINETTQTSSNGNQHQSPNTSYQSNNKHEVGSTYKNITISTTNGTYMQPFYTRPRGRLHCSPSTSTDEDDDDTVVTIRRWRQHEGDTWLLEIRVVNSDRTSLCL